MGGDCCKPPGQFSFPADRRIGGEAILWAGEALHGRSGRRAHLFYLAWISNPRRLELRVLPPAKARIPPLDDFAAIYSILQT